MKSFILIPLLLFALSKKITFTPNPKSLYEFVDCSTGDHFEFSLKEDPSTGFTWIFVEPQLGWTTRWEVAGETFLPENQENAEGPGDKIFTVDCV